MNRHSLPLFRVPLAWICALLTIVALLPVLPAAAQSASGSVVPAQAGSGADPNRAEGSGPVRLRPGARSADEREKEREADRVGERERDRDRSDRPDPFLDQPPGYLPGEFERYVQRQAGPRQIIRRLGSEIVTGSTEMRSGESSPLVPADYVVVPGDEVLVILWGSVDADLRLIVDRSGRIHIPRVGAIQVAGLRHEELSEVVARRVGQTFRNFQSSVSLGQLRGIQVFVTGYVQRPGAHTVNSLSTMVSALLAAGGPSAAGSLRLIELRRGATLLSRLDLYDLLLRGDRASDRVLQAGDVVHVGPVGVQVGFIGSVNRPAIVELRPGETVGDALRMVGGFSAVADRSRLAVERLKDRNSGRVAQLNLPADDGSSLSHGDVLRAFSAVDVALPSMRQNKRVKVEGEVLRPAEYVLPESSSLRDAVRAAGGFTTSAYLFATELTRESVQRTQQENYDRALRDLETDLAKAAGTQRVATGDEATAQTARVSAADRLIARLRALKPSGRIVLELPTDGTDLPDLALEDGDRIFVPARPTTVGVFGSVFNASSYLHLSGRTAGDYLRLAGGPTKGADESSIFVIRANGSVVSMRQTSGFFNRGDVGKLAAEPGDTIFVPEELDKTTFVQAAKDWTQILYQFGLGIAGIRAAIR